MANFTIKTIKDIYNDFMANYQTLRSKYGDNTPILEKAVIKSIAYAIAGVAGIIWRLVIWVYKQCFAQTAELDALKMWGNLIGVEYSEGTAANITIQLTDVTADYLSAGTVYKDLTTGLIFKTVSQATTEDSTIVATAECTTSGEAGNLAIGTVLNIANPLDGIPSTAVVIGIKIEGTSDENVETYRKRVLYAFQRQSESGSPLDYYNWATETSGIDDALIYVLEEGTVTIYLISDGSGKDRTPSGEVTPNPFPYWDNGNFTDFTGSGQFLSAAYLIEGTEAGVHNRRPVMATVELKAPNYTPFDVEITGLTNLACSADIKNAIDAILDIKRPHIVVLDYDESNAKINQPELSSACIGALNGASITSFTLKDEDGNIINEATLGIGCLAYLRTLTINDEVYYSADDTA